MRRFLIVAAGLLLALPAALAVLAIGLLALASGMKASTGAGLLAATASIGSHGSADLLVHSLLTLWLVGLALCFAPVAVAGLLGEAARLREVVWYAGVSGALTAAGPTLLRAAVDLPLSATGDEGRVTLLLFLTGVAAGLVYWLVAGRGAGTR